MKLWDAVTSLTVKCCNSVARCWNRPSDLLPPAILDASTLPARQVNSNATPEFCNAGSEDAESCINGNKNYVWREFRWLGTCCHQGGDATGEAFFGARGRHRGGAALPPARSNIAAWY